mgnify:FL=1
MKKFFKEFKEFINRGNVMDMAVFLMVKALNTASEKLAHKEDKPAEKPAKKCSSLFSCFSIPCSIPFCHA